MDGNDHPTFPNPTVRSATCEIRFEAAQWQQAWFGRFFERVQMRFPLVQPVSFQVFLPESSELAVISGMRYQNEAENISIQLTNERVSVNILPDYPGWPQVREYVQFAWETAYGLVTPTAVKRIGLRYINVIGRRDDDTTLEGWLVPSDYIPPAVIRSKPRFLVRNEVRLEPNRPVIVTISDQSTPPLEPNGFLIDIDSALEESEQIAVDSVLSELDSLHDTVWNVFKSAQGEQLIRLLQGEIL